MKINYSVAAMILFIHILAVTGFHSLSLSHVFLILFAHYLFALFGASFGLHKYISHRLYKIENKFFHHFVLLLSTLCLQGPLLHWAVNHRKHHLHMNDEQDPHNASQGFLWSHIGWLLVENDSKKRTFQHSLIRDLSDLPAIKFYSHNYYSINILFYATLLAVSVVLNQISLFYIFGPIRTVSVWHATWFVNSSSHGASFFNNVRSGEPQKSWIVALLIPGEGDHAFHHAHSNSLHNIHDRSLSNQFCWFVLKKLAQHGLIKYKAQDHL